MFVLHAHWQLPQPPDRPGGMIFWAEMSEGELLAWRAKKSRHPKPSPHLYSAPFPAVTAILAQSGEKAAGEPAEVTLALPTTRSGPQPSPKLAHAWVLDEETAPFLAPWVIPGVRVSPPQAVELLIRLPLSGQVGKEASGGFVLGDDVLYWRSVATLLLEALAGQKLAPVLVQVDPAGKTLHARWQPVLDHPTDGPRLALLERAMPPVCRAEAPAAEKGQGSYPLPHDLLASFIHAGADGLARRWGKAGAPNLARYPESPARAWMAALFHKDATVRSAAPPLQALLASLRAWMRNLQVAGDEAFRIAFRLEAPPPAREEEQPGTRRQAKRPAWQLHYLLQARDDPSLLVPAEEVWQALGGRLSQLGRRFEQPQEKLLAGLGYAARLFPPIAVSLKDKRPAGLSLETEQAYTFLRDSAPLLEGAGFGLLVPPWWNKPGARLGVRLNLKSKRQSSDAVVSAGLTMENLVRYRWELSVGDTTLTEAEFRSLAALKSPLVQIRGQWVQLDAGQVETAIRFFQKQELEGEFGLLDALQYSLGVQGEQAGLPIDQVELEGWVSEWLRKITQNESLEELPQPDSLNGVLRPYQRYGFSWLSFLRRWQLGACLADDMGLGKTVQTLAMLLHEKESRGSLPAPTLLVCPTSVVTNWEREVQRFAPGLTYLVHQGSTRLRGDDFVDATQAVDLVLTSYALVRQDADTIQSINWLGVILDEAQNIKNPSARQTQAAGRLRSDFRLALTGTPVENRLSELWSIMHFLNPAYLGSRQDFRRRFAIPIERYQDTQAAERLKKLTGPFILRRLKTDPRVIQDLPEKLELKDYCNLTEEQATLYQAVVEDVMQKVAESEGQERRGLVLSMLMQLKQICNHPVQYLHQGGKQAGAAHHDLEGRSGKLERLVELLEEILSEGDRALIFTQFAEMGELLAGYLPQVLGSSVQFLHGGTPAKVRDQMVRRFQEDEQGPPIFILSLKAGGTGLNLTNANHVFHFDRWWNPAVEDQATDRAFRIGQKRNVQVHKFVTTGTLEEMIDDLIESKKGLAKSVVGAGEQWLTELSTNDLRELVRLRNT